MAYSEVEQKQWIGNTPTICPRCEQEYDGDKYTWKVFQVGPGKMDNIKAYRCNICGAMLVLDYIKCKIYAYAEQA